MLVSGSGGISPTLAPRPDPLGQDSQPFGHGRPPYGPAIKPVGE